MVHSEAGSIGTSGGGGIVEGGNVGARVGVGGIVVEGGGGGGGVVGVPEVVGTVAEGRSVNQ